jgi:hypothetical protein
MQNCFVILLIINNLKFISICVFPNGVSAHVSCCKNSTKNESIVFTSTSPSNNNLISSTNIHKSYRNIDTYSICPLTNLNFSTLNSVGKCVLRFYFIYLLIVLILKTIYLF